jgi:hypothetical protein
MVERTAEAQSRSSKIQITLAELSIWPCDTSCRVGRIARGRRFTATAVT